jgi:hypothetical protein
VVEPVAEDGEDAEADKDDLPSPHPRKVTCTAPRGSLGIVCTKPVAIRPDDLEEPHAAIPVGDHLILPSGIGAWKADRVGSIVTVSNGRVRAVGVADGV